jgi:hypothetical protein
VFHLWFLSFAIRELAGLIMHRFLAGLALTSVLLVAWTDTALAGDKGDKDDMNVLTVIDSSGKEHKLKNWKFVTGTRKLSWLAPADKEPPKGKKAALAGPEVFIISEGEYFYVKRVLTFVPVESVRSFEFEPTEKKLTIRVVVNAKEEDDVKLEVLTGYTNTNIFAVEAQTNLGDLGQATVRFQSTGNKAVKSFRFSNPKPVEPLPQGRTGKIKQQDTKLPTFRFADLQPLYVTGGGQEKTLPYLHFKETVKVELAKIEKMSGEKLDFVLTLTGGKEQPPLVLLEQAKDADGKGTLHLEGLVGRGMVGWRLFPMITVGELIFDDKNK